jgi:hypothetical protein
MARAVCPARLRTVHEPSPGLDQDRRRSHRAGSRRRLPNSEQGGIGLGCNYSPTAPIRPHGSCSPCQTGSCDRDPPVSISIPGRFVRLEPLRREHLPALFVAIRASGGLRRELWRWAAGFVEPAKRVSRSGLENYFRWDDCNPYGIFLVGGAHDGELVGTTTLADSTWRERPPRSVGPPTTRGSGAPR